MAPLQKEENKLLRNCSFASQLCKLYETISQANVRQDTTRDASNELLLTWAFYRSLLELSDDMLSGICGRHERRYLQHVSTDSQDATSTESRYDTGTKVFKCSRLTCDSQSWLHGLHQRSFADPRHARCLSHLHLPVCSWSSCSKTAH